MRQQMRMREVAMEKDRQIDVSPPLRLSAAGLPPVHVARLTGFTAPQRRSIRYRGEPTVCLTVVWLTTRLGAEEDRRGYSDGSCTGEYVTRHGVLGRYPALLNLPATAAFRER